MKPFPVLATCLITLSFCSLAIAQRGRTGGEGSSGGGNGLVCFKQGFEDLAENVRKFHYVPRDSNYIDAIESVKILDLHVAIHPEAPVRSQPSSLSDPLVSAEPKKPLATIPSLEGSSVYDYFKRVTARLARSHIGIAQYLEEALADALVPNSVDNGRLEITFTKNHIEYVQNVGWVDIQGLSEEESNRCAIVTIAYHKPVDKNGGRYQIIIDEVLYFHERHENPSRSATLIHELVYLKDVRPGKTAENTIKFVSDILRVRPVNSVKGLLAFAEGFDWESTYSKYFLGYLQGDVFREMEKSVSPYSDVQGEIYSSLSLDKDNPRGSWHGGNWKYRSYYSANLWQLYNSATHLDKKVDKKWRIGFKSGLRFRDKKVVKTFADFESWAAYAERWLPHYEAVAARLSKKEQEFKKYKSKLIFGEYDESIVRLYERAKKFCDRFKTHIKNVKFLREALAKHDQGLDVAYDTFFSSKIEESDLSQEAKVEVEKKVKAAIERLRSAKTVERENQPPTRDLLSQGFSPYSKFLTDRVRYYGIYLKYPIPAWDEAKDGLACEIPEKLDPKSWVFQ